MIRTIFFGINYNYLTMDKKNQFFRFFDLVQFTVGYKIGL